MSVGIIAEYNPFHKGHLFHTDETRNRVHEPIVVALSANFTQRGLPAFCDKWSRTRMALENGASLAVEIPTFFSCASGAVFAQAVDILNALGVSRISFGVESSNLLDEISSILAQEPLPFKQALQTELDKGASFSKAVSIALDSMGAGFGDFASKPNNSLAISYLSRIKSKNYNIAPLPITRKGLGHHASATGIRKTFFDSPELFENSELPLNVQKILRECDAQNRIFRKFDKLWEFLQVVLLSAKRDVLADIYGMGEGLEGLFLKNARVASSFDDFIGRCVCARYTRSRLQRQAVRIMLGIDRPTGEALRRAGPRYVRVLGFDERGRKILREISGNSSIKAITRLAAVKDTLGAECANIEFKASALWELLVGGGLREEQTVPLYHSN